MSDVRLYEDSASRLAAQADAVESLAQARGAFAIAVAAFESRDPDAFRWSPRNRVFVITAFACISGPRGAPTHGVSANPTFAAWN